MNYLEVQNIAKQTIDYIKTVIKPNMNLREIRKLCEDKSLFSAVMKLRSPFRAENTLLLIN